MSKEEADDLMQNLDMNTNGSIDYTEFIAGCMRSKIYLKEDHLRSAFEYFDRVRGFKSNWCRTKVEASQWMN